MRRCIIVLDRDGDAYPAPVTLADADVFERAIVAAASLVLSADRVGLTTRFVTGGVDLRGPEVGIHALEVLSPIQLGPSLGELERDPGEGLGLVVVVTSSPAADAWRRTERISDPTLTRVGVFTAPGAARGRMAVDASSLTDPDKVKQFQDAQAQLSGALGRLLAVSEAYPDLKSNANFLALQSQLEGTENRINAARRDYIEAARDFNLALRAFPTVLWAKTIFASEKPLAEFTASDAAQAAPQVKF